MTLAVRALWTQLPHSAAEQPAQQGSEQRAWSMSCTQAAGATRRAGPAARDIMIIAPIAFTVKVPCNIDCRDSKKVGQVPENAWLNRTESAGAEGTGGAT